MPSFEALSTWIRSARAACATKLGIHTAAWVVARFPDWGDLSGFPLWVAEYGHEKDLAVGFGGWTRAVGLQYEADAVIGGVSCDLSWFEPQALA